MVTNSSAIQENGCLKTQQATGEDTPLGLTKLFEQAAEVNAENSDLLSERTNSVGQQNSNSNAITFGDVW